MSTMTTDPGSLTLEDLDADERDALEACLFTLADDEFVLAERYTEWQVRAPTLESDLALSNNAQDELGHARLWYDVLEAFGHDEVDLIYERPPERWRHSTLVELPFAEGDWADAIVRHYLYDVAEELRLEALEGSTYAKIADRVGKIRSEEGYHTEHAENWMERLAGDPGSDGHARVQDAVDRLFPHAQTLFEPVDAETEATIVEAGFRTATLEELAEEWLAIVVPFLEALDLTVPLVEPVPGDEDAFEVAEEGRPDVRGRDGTHTDAWPELHAELTETFHELGRTEATVIMEPQE